MSSTKTLTNYVLIEITILLENYRKYYLNLFAHIMCSISIQADRMAINLHLPGRSQHIRPAIRRPPEFGHRPSRSVR